MATTTTNSIPPMLNDLLVKLRILSMIPQNYKINIGSMSFVSKSSWLGAGYRSMNGEGRKGLMVQLNHIISQAIQAIEDYKDTEFRKLIVNQLAQTKMGLGNLLTTYAKDPNIQAQLNVLIQNVDLQLEKNKELIDGYKHHRNMIDNNINKPSKSNTPN